MEVEKIHTSFLDTINFSHIKLVLAYAKKLLDNLRRYPYHDIEAIYLSSQSLQWINDKKLRVLASHCLNFRTMCTSRLFKTSGFYLYKLKRAYKSFKTV